MQSRNSKLLIILGTLVAVILMLVKVLNSPTGGLAGMIKYAAIPLLIVCFVSPRSGLVLISFMGFYGDYYKKLAVNFGTASLSTVIEVLAVSVAMVAAVIAGAVMQVIFKGVKPDRTSVVLLVITTVLTGLLLATGGDGSFAGKVQYAVNSGLYLGLAAVICLFCLNREDALNLCRLHFWLAVPWALWAMRQYWFGFTDMEWRYAATELSPVLYSQMFLTPDLPRPYGFASTSSAYGVITFLFCFGIWHTFRYARARMAFVLCTLIYGLGLVISMQRTIMLIPFLAVGTYLLFRTKGGTIFFYSANIAAAVCLILLSEFALGNLEAGNAAIEGSGSWTNRVVRIATFADRLKGWSRLKRASSYSWFGTRWNSTGSGKEFGDEEYNHDSINKVLINFGVVGLAATGALLVWLVYTGHKTVLSIRDPMDRDAAVFVLSLVAVAGGLMVMGGNNLHSVPINLVLVTYIGLAAGAIRRNREVKEEVEEEALQPDALEILPPVAVRHPMRPASRWS